MNYSNGSAKRIHKQTKPFDHVLRSFQNENIGNKGIKKPALKLQSREAFGAPLRSFDWIAYSISQHLFCEPQQPDTHPSLTCKAQYCITVDKHNKEINEVHSNTLCNPQAVHHAPVYICSRYLKQKCAAFKEV